MSRWGSAPARQVLKALLKKGWQLKRQSGSHRVLSREEFSDYVFAFHEDEEIGLACWRGSESAQDSRLKISEWRCRATRDSSGRDLRFRIA